MWTELEYTVSNAVNQKNGFQPLKHFTALPLNDEQIYIFGGFTTGNEPTNKEFIFNATNKEMRPIESKGIKPSPRGKHVSNQYISENGDNKTELASSLWWTDNIP